jgi:hypothetical protein
MDWSLLVLFIGHLIVVAGFEKTPVAPELFCAAQPYHLERFSVVSAVAAILSNIVSNVPAVLVFRPFIAQMGTRCPVLEQPGAAQPVRTVVVPAPPLATETFPANPWIIAVTVMLATFMEVSGDQRGQCLGAAYCRNLAVSLDESTWVLTA